MGQSVSDQNNDETEIIKPPRSAQLPRRRVDELNTMYNQEAAQIVRSASFLNPLSRSKAQPEADHSRQKFLAKVGFGKHIFIKMDLVNNPSAQKSALIQKSTEDMFSLMADKKIVRIDDSEIKEKMNRSNQIRASIAFKTRANQKLVESEKSDESDGENTFDLPPQVKQTMNMLRHSTRLPFKTFNEMTSQTVRHQVNEAIEDIETIQIIEIEPIIKNDLYKSYKQSTVPFFVPLAMFNPNEDEEEDNQFEYHRSESRSAFTRTKDTRLISRSANDIRLRYLQKLTYYGVWLPPSKQSKFHQTLFVLDWDDTIFPTSFLKEKGGPELDKKIWEIAEKVTNKYKSYLARWQKTVLSILEKMMSLGKVFIITNAVEGWVEGISQIMMPRVELFIRQFVPVVSAAQWYQKHHPYDVEQWKLKTFMDLWEMDDVIDPSPECLLNLIVVGDNDFEINAGKSFLANIKYGKSCLLKLVKLQENPTPCQFEKQLMIVETKIQSIACSIKHVNQVIQTPRNTWKID